MSVLLPACAGGGAEKTVKIAFTGLFTGGNAAMGLGEPSAFRLAIDELNANASNKCHYEEVNIDDECKPDVGVQAALKAPSDSEVIAAASHYGLILKE